jgi:hypothetical protein
MRGFISYLIFIILSIPFIFVNAIDIIFTVDPDKMMETHKNNKYRSWVLFCVKLAYGLRWFKNLFRRKND